MKFFLSVLIALASFSSVAQTQEIVLAPGQVTVVSNVKIVCSGSQGADQYVGATYAKLPYSHILRILKSIKIGSCYVKTLSGNFDFFYSSSIVNGVHLNQGTQYVVRESLRNGECE